MGLDMYLEKHTYVGNQWRVPGKHNDNEPMVEVTNLPSVKTERIEYIIEQVGYWRKANHIHKWFVDNVAEGIDNCQPTYVSPEQLKELLHLCYEVLAKSTTRAGKVYVGTQWTRENGDERMYEDGDVIVNPEIAQELLPTQSGFFFGNEDYDEYYLDDVKHTINVIEEALSEKADGFGASYYYHASW